MDLTKHTILLAPRTHITYANHRSGARGWNRTNRALFQPNESKRIRLIYQENSLAYCHTIVVANGFSIFTSPSSVEGSYILRTL